MKSRGPNFERYLRGRGQMPNMSPLCTRIVHKPGRRLYPHSSTANCKCAVAPDAPPRSPPLADPPATAFAPRSLFMSPPMPSALGPPLTCATALRRWPYTAICVPLPSAASLCALALPTLCFCSSLALLTCSTALHKCFTPVRCSTSRPSCSLLVLDALVTANQSEQVLLPYPPAPVTRAARGQRDAEMGLPPTGRGDSKRLDLCPPTAKHESGGLSAHQPASEGMGC